MLEKESYIKYNSRILGQGNVGRLRDNSLLQNSSFSQSPHFRFPGNTIWHPLCKAQRKTGAKQSRAEARRNFANMKMTRYFLVCAFLFHFALSGADDAEYASVLLDPLSNKLYIENDVFESAVAWARFSNQVNTTG